MELISYCENIGQERVKVFSVGGGSIAFENEVVRNPKRIYKLDKFSSIAKYCEEKTYDSGNTLLKLKARDSQSICMKYGMQ